MTVAGIAAAPTLYDHVGRQIGALVAPLGLGPQRATVERAYALLCRTPLDVPCDRRWPGASRLNADGTPVQLSLALGAAARPRLALLTETGAPGATTGERLRAARERLADLGRLFGVRAAVPRVLGWLDRLAPAADPGLLAAEGGAVWLGTGFAPDHAPRIKVYINAKWGSEEARWRRLAAFAGGFGITGTLREIEALAGDDLAPLGVALGVAPNASPAGRIYLSGYGLPFERYEQVALAFGGAAFRMRLRAFGDATLGADLAYPTRSAVCSFGLAGGALTDVKVELCAHCAFDDDRQATRRCLTWLAAAGLDPAPYSKLVDIVSAGARGTTVHAYLGVGSGPGAPTTVYINPGPGRR
jgi:hypothetical protein